MEDVSVNVGLADARCLDERYLVGRGRLAAQEEFSLGKQEGAEVLVGGAQAQVSGELSGGYYVQPTLFKGHNKMRVFQEEIFGPVLSIVHVDNIEHAIEIENSPLRTRTGRPSTNFATASSP